MRAEVVRAIKPGDLRIIQWCKRYRLRARTAAGRRVFGPYVISAERLVRGDDDRKSAINASLVESIQCASSMTYNAGSGARKYR